MLDILGPRLEFPSPMTVDQAMDAAFNLDDFAWGSSIAQLDSIAGWTVVVEPVGWLGSIPEVLLRLAANGRALSAYWNVNAVMNVGVAERGRVIRRFDPLLYDAGDPPLPEELGLPWGVGQPRACSLALIARLSGVVVERDWLLERSRRTFVVPIPP
ncbi:MAG TPA: DUF6461 domain-containing protein [Candidatus Limnocylindrales bacterium]